MVQLDGVVDEVDFFEILARSMYIHANKKVAKLHSCEAKFPFYVQYRENCPQSLLKEFCFTRIRKNCKNRHNRLSTVLILHAHVNVVRYIGCCAWPKKHKQNKNKNTIQWRSH